MGVYAAWDEALARRLIAERAGLDGATLPMLHALQDMFGYVDAAAVPMIAEALNMSRAEVHGAISFYHDFRQQPATGRVIKLCRAEACQAVGCEALVDHLGARGIAIDAADEGPVTVETIYCLGNCALGPAALVEGELIGRLTPERLTALCEGRAVEDVLDMPAARPAMVPA